MNRLPGQRTPSRSSQVAAIALAALVVAIGALVSSAYAASEGGEHHGSIADLTWYWVNFLIYVSLLYVLLCKPLVNGWAARRERIAQEVSSATSEMEAAERELKTIESLTKSIASDKERARADILKQGELEAEALLKSAKEKSARIKSQVADLLKGEARSAQAQFRATLVAKAVELSKARFQSGDFASRQSAYIDAAVDRAKRLVR